MSPAASEKPPRIVYLDHNGSAPPADEVVQAMTPWLGSFGNPSSSHYFGRKSRQAVEHAREQVARLLGCAPAEIVFTSGGTESDNLAIRGTAERFERGHIITVATEHSAVLKTCRALEKRGFDLTVLPVDRWGRVSVEAVSEAMRADTILVTVMLANNEVGTIQPVAEIGRHVRDLGVVMHSDAAQIAGKEPVSVAELNVDLLTVAGHKFNAPKGVGALYVRDGVDLVPQATGGGHERGLRSGTLDVMEIVGLGAAAERFVQNSEQISSLYRELRDYFESSLAALLPRVVFNFKPVPSDLSPAAPRLVNTSSVSFPGVNGDALLAACPAVAASPGAACHGEKPVLSHVLTAMGVPQDLIASTVRFSLGYGTTRADLDFAVEKLAEAYAVCRV